MQTLRRVVRATDLLIDLAALSGALGLLVALAVTAIDVVGRVFNAPLYGARDIVSMAALFVVFGGMALAHRKGAHVAVDLLESKFSDRVNHVLTIVAHLLGAVIFLLIAWQLWIAVDLARMLRMSTNILYLPRAPFLMAMTALSLICAASMILRGILALTGKSNA